jgi:hypothetical protein
MTSGKLYKAEKRGTQKDLQINVLNGEITLTEKYSTNS